MKSFDAHTMLWKRNKNYRLVQKACKLMLNEPACTEWDDSVKGNKQDFLVLYLEQCAFK